jgi:hypothetical protein
MQVYMPNAADQRSLLIVPQIDTSIAVSPFFALAFRPWAPWLVTATLHAPKSWDTSGENRVRFWNYTYPDGESAVVQSYLLTQGSEPLRVGLAVKKRGNLGATAWQLGVQGVWTQWSKYRDRHGERPDDVWHDTVNLGLGWVLERAQRKLMVEFGVVPTPVPDQMGRSNYVDNTRFGTSLGLEVPFSYLTTNYALRLSLQGQFMPPRNTEKRMDAAHPVVDEVPDDSVDQTRGMPLPGAAGLQTNNPGYPGFRSWGMVLGASMVLSVLR